MRQHTDDKGAYPKVGCGARRVLSAADHVQGSTMKKRRAARSAISIPAPFARRLAGQEQGEDAFGFHLSGSLRVFLR